MAEIQLVRQPNGEYIQIVYFKKPAKFRVEILGPGGRMIRGTDGEKWWGVIQRPHSTQQTLDLPAEDIAALREAARSALYDDLERARLHGAKVDLQSDAAREGSPSAQSAILLISEKSKPPYRLQIDTVTGLITAKFWEENGDEHSCVYSGKVSVDGVAMPDVAIESSRSRETRVSRLCRVQYNADIDDAFFASPPRVPTPKPTPGNVGGNKTVALN